MSNLDHEFTHNTKAVVQETGLKADTLRAWERRYGLPQPQRTTGGHRLYSQRDIDILKWLVARQQEGLSISRAVDLWRKLEAEPKDAALTNALGTVDLAEPESKLVELRQAWISACLAFGELGAERVVTEALALYPVETICTQLFQAGLADIGQRWHAGKISAQQEHFASNYAVRKLETFLTDCPAPTRLGRILIGTPRHEEHTFSSLLLTLLLCGQGWETVYFGSDVSAERLKATASTVKPNLVILSAQQLPTAARLLDLGQILYGLEIPMAFGGLIFNRLPALPDYMPGYFMGERLEQAVQWVENHFKVPGSRRPKKAVNHASQAYKRALAHYLERQGLIETEVWHTFRSEETDPLPNYISYANKNLSRNIIAALTLGNLDFLEPAAFWVEEMLGHYRFSTDLIPRYLQIYDQVASNHLDERGQPLVDYLAYVSVGKDQY